MFANAIHCSVAAVKRIKGVLNSMYRYICATNGATHCECGEIAGVCAFQKLSVCCRVRHCACVCFVLFFSLSSQCVHSCIRHICIVWPLITYVCERSATIMSQCKL